MSFGIVVDVVFVIVRGSFELLGVVMCSLRMKLILWKAEGRDGERFDELIEFFDRVYLI